MYTCIIKCIHILIQTNMHIYRYIYMYIRIYMYSSNHVLNSNPIFFPFVIYVHACTHVYMFTSNRALNTLPYRLPLACPFSINKVAAIDSVSYSLSAPFLCSLSACCSGKCEHQQGTGFETQGLGSRRASQHTAKAALSPFS